MNLELDNRDKIINGNLEKIDTSFSTNKISINNEYQQEKNHNEIENIKQNHCKDIIKKLLTPENFEANQNGFTTLIHNSPEKVVDILEKIEKNNQDEILTPEKLYFQINYFLLLEEKSEEEKDFFGILEPIVFQDFFWVGEKDLDHVVSSLMYSTQRILEFFKPEKSKEIIYHILRKHQGEGLLHTELAEQINHYIQIEKSTLEGTHSFENTLKNYIDSRNFGEENNLEEKGIFIKNIYQDESNHLPQTLLEHSEYDSFLKALEQHLEKDLDVILAGDSSKKEKFYKEKFYKKIQVFGKYNLAISNISTDGIFGNQTGTILQEMAGKGNFSDSFKEKINKLLGKEKKYQEIQEITQKSKERITKDLQKRRAFRQQRKQYLEQKQQTQKEKRKKEQEDVATRRSFVTGKLAENPSFQIVSGLPQALTSDFEEDINKDILDLAENPDFIQKIPLEWRKSMAISFYLNYSNKQNGRGTQAKEISRDNLDNKERITPRKQMIGVENSMDKRTENIIQYLINNKFNGTIVEKNVYDKLKQEWQKSDQYKTMIAKFSKNMAQQITRVSKTQAVKTAETLLHSQGVDVKTGRVEGNLIKFIAPSPGGGEEISYNYNFITGELSVSNPVELGKTSKNISFLENKPQILLQLPSLASLMNKKGKVSELLNNSGNFEKTSDYNKSLRFNISKKIQYIPGGITLQILKQGIEKNKTQYNIIETTKNILEINEHSTLDTEKVKGPYEILIPIINSLQYYNHDQNKLEEIHLFFKQIKDEKQRIRQKINDKQNTIYQQNITTLEPLEHSFNSNVSGPKQIFDTIFNPVIREYYQKNKNLSKMSHGIGALIDGFESPDPNNPGEFNNILDIEKIRSFMAQKDKINGERGLYAKKRYPEMLGNINQTPYNYNKEKEETKNHAHNLESTRIENTKIDPDKELELALKKI